MESFDILLHGGTVLDGTGAAPRPLDIGIRDDRIVFLGDASAHTAGRIFDATRRHIAPGFIDIHTHSDLSALYHPAQESILSQGITTQIVGNCGLCLGYATDAEVFTFEKRALAAHGTCITWKTFAEHLQRVEENGIATNYVSLAGQGTLRKRVVGLEQRPPTPAERLAMRRELETAMEAGAWGISTGLEYTPSGYADRDELTELTAVVAPYGGVYATHLRNEGDMLEEAVAEALEIGERAGVSVQLSHHKAEGRRNWGKVHRTLALIEAARQRGLDVQLDQYPYPAFQTGLSVQVLPAWANVGTNEEVLARLSDPSERARILADIREKHPDWDDLGADSPWEQIKIGVCRTNREIQGHTIAELARNARKNPIEHVLDILLYEENFVSAVHFAISEEDIETVLRHPLTMIGSDAVGTAPHGSLGEDRVHPRSYGTFPRVLARYVREKGTITEAQAIHKMTGMPAVRLGLLERGRITVGHFADIVIYDPQTIRDEATFEEAHRFASGIEAVLVNGRVAWEGEEVTQARAGRVLRKN